MDIEANPKLLSPLFQSKLRAYLNADDIDLRDRDELAERALDVVAALFQNGINANEVIATLTTAQVHWSASVVQEFTQPVNIDWSFNSETEDALKSVVSSMIRGAQDQKHSL